MLEIGSYAYLRNEITEPACGDHPQFLMGKKGERVKIVGTNKTYDYTVEGSTNPGKQWHVNEDELTTNKG